MTKSREIPLSATQERAEPPTQQIGYYPVYIPQTPPAPVQPRILPHMVTIKELAAECREKGMAITEHFVRRLCLENKICHVKAGNKYLINYDRFIDYLNGEAPQEPEVSQKRGTVQPIPIKL